MKTRVSIMAAILAASLSITSFTPIYAESTSSSEQEQRQSIVRPQHVYEGIPTKLTIDKLEEGSTVTWDSSSPDIAIIDAEGNLKPITVGKTTITATILHADGTTTPLTSEIVVEGTTLTLSTTNLGTVYIGDTRQLSATATPATEIRYTSSNEAVASIDQKGNVTAKAAGTAVLSASANGKSVTCNITVKEAGIQIQETAVSLYENEGAQLHMQYDADQKPVWSSDDTNIASVDENGYVKANHPGTTTIRVNVRGKVAVVQVTVKEIKVSLDKNELTLYIGYNDKLNVSYEPSGTPTWSSDQDDIVSVDQNGNLVPRTKGTTTIRVKVNGREASAVVHVEDPFVKFSSASKTMYKGERYTPAISYGPNQGTPTYSTSKKSVATVNSKGMITAKKKGTAYITVKINGKSARLKVSVKNAMTLKKPKITSVKKSSRASLTITWKKVSGANRYYVYRSNTKKGKKTKIATAKGTSFKHKYIPGKKYYYWVKAASTNKYKYKTSGYSTSKYGAAVTYIGVATPYINQVQGGAPQGCEGASLLMALKAKGYTNIGYRDFLDGMPKSKNNPREGFIYSMYSNTPRNQVHWIDTPALAEYGKKFGNVEDISGASVGKLKYEIHRNHPVVVYVTAMFGSPNWHKFSYGSIPLNLHVVTLVGYSGRTGKYKINDPYFGVIWIKKAQFERVYNSMRKAVVVR